MTGGGELDLSGKVAMVTGAASGIGAASSERLAALGATVVGVDVDEPRGRQVFEELGTDHRFRRLDVTDVEQWRSAMSSILDVHGRLDIVHLNAGVMSRPKGLPLMDDPLDWFNVEAYRKVMSVNVDGVVFGLIAVLDRPEVSHVVITASLAALIPLTMDPFYAASKHALIGLTRSLEPALRARGVRLDLICPGAIDTAITAPDVRAGMKQEPPTLVADAVVRALSNDDPDTYIWLALTEVQGVQPYQPAGLPGAPGADELVESLDSLAGPPSGPS